MYTYIYGCFCNQHVKHIIFICFTYQIHFFLLFRHEGRVWYTNHRGRLWIHAAGKVPNPKEISEVENDYKLMLGMLCQIFFIRGEIVKYIQFIFIMFLFLISFLNDFYDAYKIIQSLKIMMIIINTEIPFIQHTKLNALKSIEISII